MAAIFESSEIFEIADKIEVAGAAFYREAALRIDDGDEKELLLKLAELEESHMSYFESLREIYSIQAVEELIDFDSKNARYLQWIAQGHVLHSLRDFFDSDDVGIIDILNKAIAFEKDTVVYFAALKAALTSDEEKEKVDMLILEETTHVGLLTQKLQGLSG